MPLLYTIYLQQYPTKILHNDHFSPKKVTFYSGEKSIKIAKRNHQPLEKLMRKTLLGLLKTSAFKV